MPKHGAGRPQKPLLAPYLGVNLCIVGYLGPLKHTGGQVVYRLKPFQCVAHGSNLDEVLRMEPKALWAAPCMFPPGARFL